MNLTHRDVETFNQFFYRKLKPTARPINCLDDPYRLVSAADCRLMTFETVNEATRLWIKGREFTILRLSDEAYKAEAERYVGGTLAISRLAPQDYYRFHSPVEGHIGLTTYISGEILYRTIALDGVHHLRAPSSSFLLVSNCKLGLLI